MHFTLLTVSAAAAAALLASPGLPAFRAPPRFIGITSGSEELLLSNGKSKLRSAVCTH
jgi:hypothetical protein